MSANLPPDPPEAPTTEQPPPPPPPQRGRLVRLKSDRVVAGVASGLGRYFGIDPVIARIAIVVLTFFGGAGALLYLAAVLLVPSEDELAAGHTPGGLAAPAGERNRGLVILGVVVLVVVAGPLLLAPALFAGGIIVPLAVLVVIGLATAWLVTGRRPERDAGAVVRATLLGLGVLLLVASLGVIAFWAAGIGGETVVAALVIAAGVAVLVAAFVKPARWLVLPALAVAVPAAFVAAAGIDLDGGVGERSYRPASATQLEERYEVGIGRLVIDLRSADLPAGDRRLDLDVGMGEAVLVVPDDVCVATDATVGMGQADVFSRGSGGVDVSWVDQTAARPGKPRLVVDADIGLGHLDVRKTDPDDRSWQDFDDEDDEDSRGWNAYRDRNDRGENTGCAA